MTWHTGSTGVQRRMARVDDGLAVGQTRYDARHGTAYTITSLTPTTGVLEGGPAGTREVARYLLKGWPTTAPEPKPLPAKQQHVLDVMLEHGLPIQFGDLRKLTGLASPTLRYVLDDLRRRELVQFKGSV